jgi:hypothetical protein
MTERKPKRTTGANGARSTALFVAALWLGGMTALAAGCGSVVDDYCNRACECVTCSDDDLTTCVETLDQVGSVVDDADCTEPYEEYLNCVTTNLDCQEFGQVPDGCTKSQTALLECVKGTPAEELFLTPCDVAANRIVARFGECGIEATTDDGEKAECTADLAEQASCTADCTDAASCGAFDGSDAEAASAWLDCLGACAPAE